MSLAAYASDYTKKNCSYYISHIFFINFLW